MTASRRRGSPSSSATTAGSCSAAPRRPPGSSGGTAAPAARELSFRIARLPLADGRFHLRVALVDDSGGRLLHTLDDALRFFVFPAGAESGAVLLDGDWTLQETGERTPTVPA